MSIRLLAVLVQPIMVEDDGENLTELPTKPVRIHAKDFRDYPESVFKEIEKLNTVEDGD